ncbi:MAG: malectin domain-containing carbohydrate-binding protein [Segetibacter sp.]
MWYPKGTDSLKTLFTHIGRDGQTVLPRRGRPNLAASGSFSPKTAFGLKVGGNDNTDASKNPGGKIGIRVWKAYDANGNIIPNSYILSNDYLGNRATNYDYNDNMYFVKNVRPEKGKAYNSVLAPAPSALDFGEKLLNSTNSLKLKLSSLGQIYADSSKDPAIKISSVAIVGENKSEFSAFMPVKRVLLPQDSTTLTVKYKPVSQGLKIADLLIYYNNSKSPLRVPLYGIALAADSTVIADYRINSGSATPITINGKTWSADNQYSFDNIEPYRNINLTKIAGTDEDSLYLKEQSSNADKRSFRYRFPVKNGDYVVRLHFAEIYWGAPGSGINGGAGSRIMNISLENQLRLINFDVTQEVGGATALVKNIPVTVTDSILNIDFDATINRPMVVAVEVYSFHASALLSSVIVPDPNISTTDNTLKKPKVYPNPLGKRFKIEFPGEYSGYSTLQIADVAGRTYEIGKIKLQRGRSNNMEVNISGLALKPGFYYLKVLYETRPTDIIKLIVK